MLNIRRKSIAACSILIALLAMPAPVLPPHRLAELMQSMFKLDWKAAYLIAAIVSQSAFYVSVGMMSAFAVDRADSRTARLRQTAVGSAVLVAVVFVIRSLKLGFVPVWANAVVPIIACLVGIVLGLGLMNRRWKASALVVFVLAASLWGLLRARSGNLREATQEHLQKIVATGRGLPPGDRRFGLLLQAAFAPISGDSTASSAIQQNRASILAWGIVVGHSQLATFVGLEANSPLLLEGSSLGQGTTLRGREDWAQHYAVSSALTVLEHPLLSDAGGLMKEQLDALTRDSGFSFGDLAADRAGVRFADAATDSEAAARAMQERLRNSFAASDFFPPAIDLPENLTVEEFRRRFGGVGTRRYRVMLTRIESELNGCAALSP